MASVSTMGTWPCSNGVSTRFRAWGTTASPLCLHTGSRTRTGALSLKPVAAAAPNSSSNASGLLRSSFLGSSLSLSLSSSSSFSGLSLGLDFSSGTGLQLGRRHRLVVRMGKKYQLAQTKRNRSRKSLARTHGFRLRMRTPNGRATIKRRRAKGRWVLCTKSNPSSGKRA